MNLSTLTKQKDHSVYSKRYGCAGTAVINIAEITRMFPCTDREVDSVVGNWDRTGNVTVCNYERVGPNWSGVRNEHIQGEPRWYPSNDQQSHFRIQSWSKALRDVFWSLDIALILYLPSHFEIVEYSGPGISCHFCLDYDGTIINPDPSIDIGKLEIVDRFRI